MERAEPRADRSLLQILFGTSSYADRPGARRGLSRRQVAAIDVAAQLFKALSHEGRLQILCHLTEGERSVSELENLLDLRQSVVSQHLARLRAEGLVSTRRSGQTIFYSLKDRRIVGLLDAFQVTATDEEWDEA